MIELDDRGFCVALVADELINEQAAGFDLLAVLDRGGWGVIALPPAWYGAELSASLLEQVAEHVQEFQRHGYGIVQLGDRNGLQAALDRAGVSRLDRLDVRDAERLAGALARRATAIEPRDAAAHQRDRPA